MRDRREKNFFSLRGSVATMHVAEVRMPFIVSYQRISTMPHSLAHNTLIRVLHPRRDAWLSLAAFHKLFAAQSRAERT